MHKAIFVLDRILSVFEFSFCPVIFPVRFFEWLHWITISDCWDEKKLFIFFILIYCFLAENKDKIICKEIISNIRALKMFLFVFKCRKETPQKLTQLSSRSHPRHLVGKRTAQKDITMDTTSDSQVNSHFPNKWSPASLTFNNYFYLFLYLYITWISTNNNAPHLKSPKNQKQKSCLGTASNKNYWGALN